MEFILARAEHLEEMCRITTEAKAQLKRLGLDQWQKGYPSREVWEEDIKNQMAWLAVEGENVLGVFAFQTTPDVSYGEIDGKWLTDTPYASMHRVCVSDESKGKGVAGQMFAYGFSMAEKLGFGSVRIDTHPGNMPMQRALKKAGFVPCGTIILKGGSEDGDARIAFERILQKRQERMYMEIVDVVDKRGVPTGEQVEREQAHTLGIRHRTSHVWIVRRKEGRLQVLLQKRSENKDSFPGCYDISSAGHIPAGVDFVSSAVRELKEELGCEVKPDELIYCGQRCFEFQDTFHGKVFHDNQVSNVYALWLDREPEMFSLQKEEVSEVKWFDFQECMEKVEKNEIPNCIFTEELKMVEIVANTGIKGIVLQEIRELARKYDINKVILFGSRARGDFHRTSDIDLASEGGDQTRFALDVDDQTSTLLKFDIINLDGVVQKELLDSIEKEGIVIYEKI